MILFHIVTNAQLQIISVSSLVASHCNDHISSYGNLLLLGGAERNIYINNLYHKLECYYYVKPRIVLAMKVFLK